MADPEDCQVLIAVFLLCPQDQRDLFNAAESPAGEPVDDDRPSLEFREARFLAGQRALEREISRREFGRSGGARRCNNACQNRAEHAGRRARHFADAFLWR